MVMGTQALALATEVTGYLPPTYGVPVHALLSALYAVSRGVAKSGVAPVQPAPVGVLDVAK